MFWDESLSFVRFAYNRVIHSTTYWAPLEVVCGFNLLTPLDLLRIPSNIVVSEATTSKADLIKTLHREMKKRIEKQNFKVASRSNKEEIIFQPSDWVWIHFRKERFPSQRKTKLHPRGRTF